MVRRNPVTVGLLPLLIGLMSGHLVAAPASPAVPATPAAKDATTEPSSEDTVLLFDIDWASAEADEASRTRLHKQLTEGIASLGFQPMAAAPLFENWPQKKKNELTQCRADVSCVAKLFDRNVATLIITGEVTTLLDARVLYLKVYETGPQKERPAVTVRLTDGLVIDSVSFRPFLVQLLTPDKFIGGLTLRYVDENDAPTPPPRLLRWSAGQFRFGAETQTAQLPARRHALRIQHPDFHDVTRLIDVPFESEVTVDVPLVPRTSTWDPKGLDPQKYERGAGLSWKWAAGIAAAALVTGVTLGVLIDSDAPSYDDVRTPGLP